MLFRSVPSSGVGARASKTRVKAQETDTKVQASQEKEEKGPEGGDAPDVGKVGSRFGNYEIISEIARGGMGIVYKAKQLHLNRIVALKVLLAGGAASETDIQRFRREAEAAGSLQHPNIVSIYEIGEQEGYHYFTMDYIEGETLQALIKKKTRRKVLFQIMEKVARALEHAHQREIVHRDIKPSNILVSPEMEPKLTDFGLAKKLDATTMLTESGATLGTPFYMAPEQTLGQKDIDRRADIYSMGVILYEILTHRLPFNAGTLVELYHKIVEEDPVPPSKLNRKVEKGIELVCLKCMEKDPRRRYQNSEELAEDIKRYLSGEAVSAKKASTIYRMGRKVHRYRHACLIGGAIVVLLVFLTLLFFLPGIEKPEQERRLIEAKVILEQAKSLIKVGNFSEAFIKFEQAISRCPQFKDAYIAYGDAYLMHKEYYKAEAEYHKVLKIDPNYAPAYYGKGRAFLGRKEWQKAVEQFSLAIQHNPNYIEAYVGRGSAFQNKGLENSDSEDLEKAIKDHEKADRLKKADVEKGNEFLGKKDYANALNHFERVLSVDNKYTPACYGKGKIYLAQNKWDIAIAQFTTVLENEPESIEAYLSRADAYKKRGEAKSSQEDMKLAEEDLSKARSLREKKK